MRRAKLLFTHPLELVLSLLLLSIVAVTFSQVVSRYLLHVSLSWSEELARFLLIWLSMLGAAYGFKVGSHFSLMVLISRFGVRLRRIIGFAVAIAVSVFLVIFVIAGLKVTESSFDHIAPGTGLPMAVPYAATVVGGLLMLYYVIRNAWRELRHSQDPLIGEAK